MEALFHEMSSILREAREVVRQKLDAHPQGRAMGREPLVRAHNAVCALSNYGQAPLAFGLGAPSPETLAIG